MIARGQVVRRAVTIPEGLTSKAAAAIVDAETSLVGRYAGRAGRGVAARHL